MKSDCLRGEPWRLAEIDYLLSSWITIIPVVLLPCNIVVCQHTNLFQFSIFQQISDHVGIPYSTMVTEELSGMAVDQSSCPVQLDFLSKVPSITALSVSSV